jgi:cell division protein FtsN
MLLIGIVIGALASAFYTGIRSGDPDRLGSGLKQLLEVPRADVEIQTLPLPADRTPPRVAFDFFTVLPDERVIPEAAGVVEAETEPDEILGKEKVVRTKKSNGYYMLQVASYTEEAKADQLKAKLAKTGFVSSIQHISVQGQSDFYRVRVGPFFSMSELEQVNRQLTRKGIEALPLKVSRP